MSEALVSIDFEVFGTVQGVFFRKYTQQTANSLGVTGWCKNTHSGTVQGVIEGTTGQTAEMKEWLTKTGSPQSRIDRAVFSKENSIVNRLFTKFTIKR